jgi:hypothetical protein
MNIDFQTWGVAKSVRTLWASKYRLLTFLALYCAALALYKGLMPWGAWERASAAGVTAMVLALGVVRLRDDYVASLRYRARATSGMVSWRVQMNDVEVGRLEDTAYAQMRLDVANDPRVYLAQLGNVVRGAFTVLSSGYTAVPIFAFWALLALAVVSPATLLDWLATARAQSASELATSITASATLLATSLLMMVAVCQLLGLSSFGFTNCFDAAVGRLVRQRLGVMAEGKLVLTQWRFANPLGENDALLDAARVLVRQDTVSR